MEEEKGYNFQLLSFSVFENLFQFGICGVGVNGYPHRSLFHVHGDQEFFGMDLFWIHVIEYWKDEEF